MALGFSSSLKFGVSGTLPVAVYLALLGLTGSNAGANFEEGKYWLPSTSDPTSRPRWSTQGEFFAQYLASSTNRSWTDINGILQPTQAVNTPRFSYVGGRKWLGLNNGSTNLITSSNVWSNNSGNTPATSVQNAIGPDGIINSAYTVTEGLTSGGQYSATTLCSNTAVTTTLSAFVKAGTATRCQLTPASSISTAYANFRLTGSGTVLASGGGAINSSISQLGNTAWYRISITFTAAAVTSVCFVAHINSDTATRIPSYAGTGLTFCVYGAQVESNTFASPYIATSGNAAARAIETFELPAAAEAVLQQTAASVLVRGMLTKPFSASGRRILGISGGNYLIGTGNANETQIVGNNGTTALGANLGSGSLLTGFGAAEGFDASGRSIVANGGVVASDANGPGTRTNIYLGRDANNTNYADGYYNTIAIFPSRLTNTQLQTLAVPA